jgi:hypothetical protein
VLNELGLEIGKPVTAVVKASDVMLAIDYNGDTSAARDAGENRGRPSRTAYDRVSGRPTVDPRRQRYRRSFPSA